MSRQIFKYSRISAERRCRMRKACKNIQRLDLSSTGSGWQKYSAALDSWAHNDLVLIPLYTSDLHGVKALLVSEWLRKMADTSRRQQTAVLPINTSLLWGVQSKEKGGMMFHKMILYDCNRRARHCWVIALLIKSEGKLEMACYSSHNLICL